MFIDEETGGFISLCFFCLWALIWFCIGKHVSNDFTLKKKMYKQKFPLLTDVSLNKIFMEIYTAKIAKTLSYVFFYSILFYAAANIKNSITLKNCIYIGILMFASIMLRYYSKWISHKSH